jgi:hypothetical protein
MAFDGRHALQFGIVVERYLPTLPDKCARIQDARATSAEVVFVHTMCALARRAYYFERRSSMRILVRRPLRRRIAAEARLRRNVL